MEYITVENNIITGHFCTSGALPEGAIKVQPNFPAQIGMSLDYYKNDFSGLKSLEEQVADGLITIPDGYKINNNQILPMLPDEIVEHYEQKRYSVPGTYTEISIYPSFLADYKDFGYHYQDGSIEMKESQPDSTYFSKEDGTWEQDLDKVAANVRSKRDELLNECDYLLNSDYPISKTNLTTVKEYRQKLRDIPAQSGFPTSIAWPDKPEIIK